MLMIVSPPINKTTFCYLLLVYVKYVKWGEIIVVLAVINANSSLYNKNNR